MRSLAEDEEIERALQYLVHSFESSGDNPKPVILHSTRVGMDLYRREHERRVVVAGICHDLLEDTAVTADEIEAEFGDDVAEIVAAVSYDEGIDDYLDRHLDIYDRCVAAGRPAMLVKAADILDNSDYYGRGDDRELYENQCRKMEQFVERSEPFVGETDLHRELRDALSTVRDRVRDD